jgi:hypothetical protein
MSAMATRPRAVIAQKEVDAKTNKITQVRALLDGSCIAGALVTADAADPEGHRLLHDRNFQYGGGPPAQDVISGMAGCGCYRK